MWDNNFTSPKNKKEKFFFNIIFDINFFKLFYAGDKGIEIRKPGGGGNSLKKFLPFRKISAFFHSPP